MANNSLLARRSPTGGPPLSAGPVALYGQVASILRERIHSGAWAYGVAIPTLEDLVEEFGVGRVTVRQAVQLLVDDGLLSAQRGRRTKVTQKPPGGDARPLFTSIDPIAGITPEYQVKVLACDKVTAASLPEPFIGRFAGLYVRLRKIDYENGEPYSTSVHYMAYRIFARFLDGEVEKKKIARLVRDYCEEPIKICRERISVTSLGYEEAQFLDSTVGSHAGHVTRIFTGRGTKILYYGTLVFKGSRFGIERDITDLILPAD